MAEIKIQQRIYTNSVLIRGTIQRKYRKDKEWMVIAIVTTPRTGKRDVLPVFWYGDAMEQIDKQFQVNDSVEVQARIRTSKKYRTETIVGETIRTAPREIEMKFGIPDVGRVLEDENEVRLLGDVVHVYVPDFNTPTTILTLKTVTDGETSFPKVLCYQKQFFKAKNLKNGDRVCVLGHVQMHDAEDKETGKRRELQDIVCHYLAAGAGL